MSACDVLSVAVAALGYAGCAYRQYMSLHPVPFQGGEAMNNRALVRVPFLGLLTLVLVPGFAAAASQGPEIIASTAAEWAVAAPGPVISIAPLSHDYGIVNVGVSASFDFTITNTGDAPLSLGAATVSDTQVEATFSSEPLDPGASTPLSVKYRPSSGAALAASVTVTSDASNGAVTVNLSGRGNTAPVFDPALTDKSGFAFVLLTFSTPATDAEGDGFTFSAEGLPANAAYDPRTGLFAWTPGPADAGVHVINFCVTDSHATSCQAITITVVFTNNPPTADPGGPYNGCVGLPVQYDGSGSSDPDGNMLTYAWDFGDAPTGTGVGPTHTYTAAGTYTTTLTVTDNGTPTLPNTAKTTTTVTAALEGTFTGTAPNGLNLGSNSKLEIMFQPSPAGAWNVANWDPVLANTKLMATGYTGSATPTSLANGSASFSASSIYTLLVPPFSSRNYVTVPMQLELHLKGVVGCDVVVIPCSLSVKLPGAGSVAAYSPSALGLGRFRPNPTGRGANLSLAIPTPGVVHLAIYDVSGRRVASVVNQVLPSGWRTVEWDGRDALGRPVPSGTYFARLESGGQVRVGKIVVAR